MKRRNYSFLLPFALVFTGCDKLFVTAPDSGELSDCVIESTQKNEAQPYSSPTITVTVRNVSDIAASNVDCIIDLKIGDAVVDEAYLFFGMLEPGESYAKDASFSGITSHSDYDYAEYHLAWNDGEADYVDPPSLLLKKADTAAVKAVSITEGNSKKSE